MISYGLQIVHIVIFQSIRKKTACLYNSVDARLERQGSDFKCVDILILIVREKVEMAWRVNAPDEFTS